MVSQHMGADVDAFLQARPHPRRHHPLDRHPGGRVLRAFEQALDLTEYDTAHLDLPARGGTGGASVLHVLRDTVEQRPAAATTD